MYAVSGLGESDYLRQCARRPLLLSPPCERKNLHVSFVVPLVSLQLRCGVVDALVGSGSDRGAMWIAGSAFKNQDTIITLPGSQQIVFVDAFLGSPCLKISFS